MFVWFIFQPVKVEAKDAKPQTKGEITGSDQAVNQSFSGFSYAPAGPPSYETTQPFYNNQEQLTQQAPAANTESHTDYTDAVEQQAVEEENARDAEAEKEPQETYDEGDHDNDMTGNDVEVGDLTNPSNPLFGKYDVPASPKKAVFCPPCGKKVNVSLLFLKYVGIFMNGSTGTGSYVYNNVASEKNYDEQLQKEADWSSGHCVGLVIRWCRAGVPLWPLA